MEYKESINLISRDSKGKLRVVKAAYGWDDSKHGYVIHRTTGCFGGKLTEQPELLITKGKVNRTILEQVKLEFNSIIKKYKDKAYIELDNPVETYSEQELNELFGEVKTDQQGIIKPQLAKQADKIKNRKIFDKTWMISRKLDGVKALFYYDGEEIHTTSRGGSTYDVGTKHLRNNSQLIKFFERNPNIILDGEIFKRFKSLQTISGAVRLETNSHNCNWLEYWVYDCYNLSNNNIIARDRQKFLYQELVENCKFQYYSGDDTIESPIKLLAQDDVIGWNEMIKIHDLFVYNEFEGAVIKDPDKPYIPGSRGNQLIKIKQYKSEEFLVIDYILGQRGSEDMCFICQLKDGRTFKAMPCGDRILKEEYIKNFKNKYKGHLAECTFFNYSDDLIPTQAKMRVFRFDLE